MVFERLEEEVESSRSLASGRRRFNSLASLSLSLSFSLSLSLSFALTDEDRRDYGHDEQVAVAESEHGAQRYQARNGRERGSD